MRGFMRQISIVPTGAGPSQAECIGSVKDVIAGHMPQHLDGKTFESRRCRYGFLLGSPRDKYSLGETVIVNNTCYTTSTDTTASIYNKTISGPLFVTSGIFLIPHQALPSHTIDIGPQQGLIQLNDFYNKVYRFIGKPFAFVGQIEFEELHGVAIGKSPIDGLNIFENEKIYYPFSPIQSKNVSAFIIGALAAYSQEKHTTLDGQLEAVLYRTPHPGDTNVQHITSHAHALTLHHRVSKTTDITPQIADRVLHVLPDRTVIAAAHVEIFVLQAIESHST
jgi:hypothetical protein